MVRPPRAINFQKRRAWWGKEQWEDCLQSSSKYCDFKLTENTVISTPQFRLNQVTHQSRKHQSQCRKVSTKTLIYWHNHLSSSHKKHNMMCLKHIFWVPNYNKNKPPEKRELAFTSCNELPHPRWGRIPWAGPLSSGMRTWTRPLDQSIRPSPLMVPWSQALSLWNPQKNLNE